MKKTEIIQIKGLDIKELKQKADTLRKEIANLTMDKNMKKLKDIKVISKKKKELALVLTVVRQKEMLAQLESRDESQESGKKASEEVKLSKTRKEKI